MDEYLIYQEVVAEIERYLYALSPMLQVLVIGLTLAVVISSLVLAVSITVKSMEFAFEMVKKTFELVFAIFQGIGNVIAGIVGYKPKKEEPQVYYHVASAPVSY
jgi:hypothetical protein